MSGSVTGTGQTTMGQTSSGSSVSGSNTSTSSAADSLSTLTSNFSTFLKLLMTQLKNQDPSSPMDTSQFTSELVQFSTVEQQINTNSNLSTLIQLQQGSQIEQATAIVGHKVTATSSQLTLQNGNAAIQFTPPAAEPVSITVSNSAGGQLYTQTIAATAGSNSWTWNGQSQSGGQLPDGAYTVSVVANNRDGSGTTLPTTVTGTATGVTQKGTSVQLNLGSLPVDFSAITAVNNS